MNDSYTLIIPDVHGRTFWRRPVQKALDDERCADIVFLGDYVDPYPHEDISDAEAISMLQEIIGLKTQHPLRIHLLLGNHDLGYIYDPINDCRRDWEHYTLIQQIFKQNMEHFDLAWETTIESAEPTERTEGTGSTERVESPVSTERTEGAGSTERTEGAENTKGQHFLFTHAGIVDGWMQRHPKLFKDRNTVQAKRLNELLHREENDPNHRMLMDALADVSWVRGGWCWNGSMVWADEYELRQQGNSLSNTIQVFGHSQQRSSPVHISQPGKCDAYCLDCREAFILDGHGLLHHENGQPV